MLARKAKASLSRLVLLGLALSVTACASHSAAPPPAASAPPGASSELQALDKFGAYRARRVVVAPVAAVRLAPGDDGSVRQGEAATVATLGRERDAGSMLLLRFSVDLSPETAILDAHVVLDQAPSVDSDPTPITLHAARIVEPWDPRSIAWGRAPRLDDARFPEITLDGARARVRIDVRSLVQRWRRHAPDDQGIAILAGRTSVTGMTFAFADGGGAGGDERPVLSVRSPGPPSLFASSEPADVVAESSPRGPRLELYVRP
ncbi:MAG: DNRLRE domain-containing protein [Polyangiaceae bacterium]